MSEKNQNKIRETVISKRFDAECNEINPTITFDLFYEDCNNRRTQREVMTKTPPGHYQMLTDLRSDERFGIIDA